MSQRLSGGVCAWVMAFSVATSSLFAAPRVKVSRVHPCNLFSIEQPVHQDLQLVDFAPGETQVTARVQDYFGREVWAKTLAVQVEAGKPAALTLEIGKLPAGYYELSIEAAVDSDAAATTQGKASFGVTRFVNRSAAQVRENGYRFGLKWWNGVIDKGETLEMMSRLGLQWTRLLFTEGGDYSINRMLTQFPMNAVIKVERFPRELYDETRYGPIKEWEKKFGRGQWVLKTLPKKEAYQAWLREQLAKLPAEQNVFEIWNEPWSKLSPEDFATLCQWIVPVIVSERPDAIIGPNLLGNTSKYQYDARVIAAGGMEGMEMVALHPYAASENRQWLRDYHQWLHQQLGRDIDLYVTEYGSHSTPAGPAQRSETEQAQRVVSQSLSLYAEGVKVLLPHWAGQTERNRTFVEDWYGFIRRNQEPKPVLLAYATCARMIDASRYVGDLWYGPGLDAMLFERGGVYTLALITRGETKEVDIEPGTAEVTLVNMVGDENRQKVGDGKLHLTVDGNAVYVVGVSPDLARQASRSLRPDRWPRPAKPPRMTRTIHRFKTPPVLDGKFDDWKGMTELALLNLKVNAETDASGSAYLGWDADNLYVGIDMRDDEVLNRMAPAKLYREDSLELFISTEPREEDPGYGPHDHQFFAAPTSGAGVPFLGRVADRAAGKLADVPGARFFAGKTAHGWVVEMAIPWRALDGFAAAAGAKAALEMRVNDADSSHPRFKIDPTDTSVDTENATGWPYLLLAE